ncbi:hypothetical protein LSH36_147g01006 [Paralvinella palmiformis]|uniref:Uncharacterized protein n=1 Tax=Paralvinella palmiformis TaxID=53620 RepID=A0AAD9JV47_9ANNE|nr:hypothetical protein LSH36_147g01006 [Paralvinella palmiformis]
MSYGYKQLLMIVATICHLGYGNQYIFSTARNVKTPNITVIESVIVKDFDNDCEFLCYKNPTRCIAANIIPLEDNTYLCEFVSVKVTSEYLSAFETNPNGKYISRTAVVQQKVNVANQNQGANCTASSTYDNRFVCTNALDGVKTGMLSE